MKKDKKDKLYWYLGRQYKILTSIKPIHNSDEVYVVCEHVDGYFPEDAIVIRESSLSELDNSYLAVKTRALQEEIDKLCKVKQEKVDEILDRALKTLAFRMKFNTLLSTDDRQTQIGLTLAREIQKLIKSQYILKDDNN